MESEQIVTFFLGAGSAGSIVGALMLWRLKRMWTNIDAIPDLIKAVNSMDESVKGFAGELKSLERSMYQNQTDLAVAKRDLQTAFKRHDELREEIREIKL